MSKRAGWVTGGIFSALGVVVCVACSGCQDRHAPHSVLLQEGLSNHSGDAHSSACIDAQSESTLEQAAGDRVQIHVHLPQDAMAAGGPAVIVTVTLPDDMPAASPMPSDVIEGLCAVRIETRM